jgi:tetratricopeptide (TPR) repeat protein
VGDCQRSPARGRHAGAERRAAALVAALLLGAIASCSSALPKEEIDRFEGFAGDTDSALDYQRADKLLAGGEPGNALEIAKRLRDKFPRNIFVHRLYQDSRIAVGEKNQVLAEYEELAKKEPSALTLTLLSRVQPEPEKGALYAQQAYELDDRFPWAWYAFAWWNAKLGNGNKVEAALRRAIDLNPDFLQALRTYAHLKRDETGAAADAIAKYVARYPQKRNEQFLLAWLRMSLGGSEVQEAEKEFRRRLEEKPDDPAAALCLAMALLELDRWREAKTIYERLLVTNPKDPSPEYNLAVVAEYYEHDYPKAIDHLERYLDKGVDEPFLLQSRARLYMQELLEKLPPSQRASRPESRP